MGGHSIARDCTRRAPRLGAAISLPEISGERWRGCHRARRSGPALGLMGKTPRRRSADMGRFGRQMELEADREGLMMMAQRGISSRLRSRAAPPVARSRAWAKTAGSIYAMHPCWEERDRELSRAYVAAEHRICAAVAGVVCVTRRKSAGGCVCRRAYGPKDARERMGNPDSHALPESGGAVEVVLSSSPARQGGKHSFPIDRNPTAQADPNLRQLTGCTSPKTTMTFASRRMRPSA